MSRLPHCRFTLVWYPDPSASPDIKWRMGLGTRLALPIVSPSLCPLSRFLANNSNGKLSLDGYFVHQQTVIQHLWRWRAPSVNLRLIRTLNIWSLRIAPAHSRVGEGLRRQPIDWLTNACGRNDTERRKPLESVLCSNRTLCHSA